jgi:hypothetical protein
MTATSLLQTTGDERLANAAETRADIGLDDEPTPPTGQTRIRLTTVDDVRAEMARVYREMRRNKLDIKKGNAFVFVLGQLGRLTQAATLEQRILQLEQLLNKRGGY